MQLAKVIGSVVSTQKTPSLTGKKLLLVQLIHMDGAGLDADNWLEEVAADCVGAGEGETVLVARGASARRVFPEPNDAIDLAVVAIVDAVSR
ncbi:EutN/CcmL family microcompartment protein [Pseudaeromonas sp. ZJS20]|uniref:EutN/CcmL family microcompartment protein n=1 Tax=Pseudaeromonas aegiceratis TaxID=3153928 RepID=UPI00390CBB42